MKDIKVKTSDNFFTKRREPFRYMLWLGISGIALMFFVLSILYAKYQFSQISSDNFPLPGVFWMSTLFIVASSITLHNALRVIEREQFLYYRVLIGSTFGLGCLFVIFQILGWNELHAAGVFINSGVASSFLYVLSGLHLLHILGGLFFLLVAFIEALRHRNYVDSFIYSVNPPNQLRLKLISVYWHFVDALWIYLFLFFLYFHP